MMNHLGENKQIKNHSIIVIVLQAAAALMLAVGASFRVTTRWAIVVIPILSILAFFSFYFFPQQRNRRVYIASAVFSVLLTAAVRLGPYFKEEPRPWWLVDLLTVLCLAVLCFVISVTLLIRFADTESLFWSAEKGRWKSWQVFLFSMAVITVLWMPNYLRCYPGNTTVDSYYVMRQAIGMDELNDWHPVTYTLIVRVLMKFGMLFGSVTIGTALFSLVQMLFIAGGLAYGICWLYKKHLRFVWVVLITLFFSLSSVLGTLSITIWKDIPFGMLVLLFSLNMYDILESNGEKLLHVRGTLTFVALGVLMALMRHNGLYVLVMVAVVLAIYMRKHILRVLPALLGSIILAVGIQNLYYIAGAEKGIFSESLSIPVQQIARTVVTEGSISDEQQESLENFFDLERLKTYEPYLADNAKNSLKQDYLNAHKTEFFKLWASLLPANFEEYVRAYALQTYGYWSPLPAYCYLNTNSNAASGLGVVKINWLDRVPVLGDIGAVYYFISIGIMVWVIIFLIVFLIYQRRKRVILAFLPLVGAWGTLMMATPVADEFRYILALPFLLPFLIVLAARRPQKLEKDILPEAFDTEKNL